MNHKTISLCLCAVVTAVINGVLPAAAGVLNAQEYCKQAQPTKPSSASERWTNQLNTFANSKAVATEADSTLSKLISANSPLIPRWLERNGLNGKDEESIVKAWRLYFAQAQLSEYPPPEAKLEKPVTKFLQEAIAEFFPKKQREHFEGIFSEAKKSAIVYLRSLNDPNLEAAIQRIKTIRLFWASEILRQQKKSPLEFFEWGIAYDPDPNVINMGLGAFDYPNDSTLFAVFLHEIGHAFDSCRWSAYFKGSHPFTEVLDCLRKDGNAGAKRRDDSKLAELKRAGAKGEAIVANLLANPTCNRTIYPPVGVQADQLPETFADWFSAEVVARSKHLKPGLRADLCIDKELRAGSSYLSNKDRLEKIYFVQPAIAKAFAGFRGKSASETKNPTYCAVPESKPSSSPMATKPN